MRTRKYSVNDDFFETIDTEEKAYWLGFIYADGYVTTHKNNNSKILEIGLKLSDKEHLEKFKVSIESNHRIFIKNDNVCKISIVSKKLYYDLDNLGINEKKSLIIKPKLEKIPNHLQHHFIRGIFDGDGGFTIGDKYTTFAVNFCGTVDTCRYVLEFFDLHLKINKKNEEVNFGEIRIKGNKQAQAIADQIYKDSTVYLDRKYNQYVQLQQLNQVLYCIDEINKLEFSLTRLKIINMMESGLTGEEIASTLGCVPSNLTRYVKDYKQNIREDNEQMILDLYKNTTTNKSEIHRLTGFSRDYIRKVIKSFNN